MEIYIYISVLVQVNKEHHQPQHQLQHQWLGVALGLSGEGSSVSRNPCSRSTGAIQQVKTFQRYHYGLSSQKPKTRLLDHFYQTKHGSRWVCVFPRCLKQNGRVHHLYGRIGQSPIKSGIALFLSCIHKGASVELFMKCELMQHGLRVQGSTRLRVFP